LPLSSPRVDDADSASAFPAIATKARIHADPTTTTAAAAIATGTAISAIG
jgi:hypothetical protein